jgi:hypothetical protein
MKACPILTRIWVRAISTRFRSSSLTLALLFGIQAFSAEQVAHASSQANQANNTGYRIAGTAVSAVDGSPLPRARISLKSVKSQEKLQSVVTAENGKFEFRELPAGKYSLTGEKRGFISAAYDQHDELSTAIVTGVGVDTEALVLRLVPDAVINGKVLDEVGEPVRSATVILYYDDHSEGVDQIHQVHSAVTDDQGAFEIPSLIPGTYFVSANAKPWYAIYPGQVEKQGAASVSVDHSLDVAYPVTYYGDVTEAESAMPIPVRGGERLQVDIHLTPVPALHLFFQVPNRTPNGPMFTQLQQTAFDDTASLSAGGVRVVSPGLLEVSGIPSGKYNVRIDGAGPAIQMNGVDLSKDGQDLDMSKAETLSSIKVSVHQAGESEDPLRLAVGLQSGNRAVAGWEPLNSKGVAEFQQIAAGRYEIVVNGPEKHYSIAHISAEAGAVSGHTLTVAAGSSPSVSITLASGSVDVRGIVKHGEKAVAGAMIVLVPKDSEVNRDLFRRGQSDLDGTFNLPDVVPGSYTILAIENGWELEWSRPNVIAAYLKRGQMIEVGNQRGQPINLSEPIEVQSK